jgi:Domain of unknown function (DUF397)
VSSSAGPSAREVTVRDRSATWIKSSHSGPTGGNCVEVAFLTDGDVAMRNSRYPDGPALVFTRAEWAAFIGGARDGEFAVPD